MRRVFLNWKFHLTIFIRSLGIYFNLFVEYLIKEMKFWIDDLVVDSVWLDSKCISPFHWSQIIDSIFQFFQKLFGFFVASSIFQCSNGLQIWKIQITSEIRNFLLKNCSISSSNPNQLSSNLTVILRVCQFQIEIVNVAYGWNVWKFYKSIA